MNCQCWRVYQQAQLLLLSPTSGAVMNRIRWACLLAVLPLAVQAASPSAQSVCKASQPAAASQRLTKVGEDVYRRFESPHPYLSRTGRASAGVRTEVLHYPGAAYIAPHFE